MKFKVIQSVLKEGHPIDEDLSRQLQAFGAQVKIKTFHSMAQSSFTLKNGTPIVLTTICYEEKEQVEPGIAKL